MAKTKISVYLVKEGLSENDVIDGLTTGNNLGGKKSGPNKKEPPHKDISGVGKLYYATTNSHRPQWVDSFFDETSVDGIDFTVSNSSAVLLVEAQGRLFAITFGFGRNLLNSSALVQGFGLRVVLNSAKDDEYRKANTTSVAGNAGKTAEQLPKLSSLNDFDINHITDTLDKVDVRIAEDDIFEGSASGGDALSYSTDEDVYSIRDQLGLILNRYESNTYKDNGYEWIDDITPVKDKAVIDRLERRAVELINARDERMWTAPAHLIDSWDAIQGFTIQGLRGKMLPDIMMADVLDSFSNGLTDFSQLKSKTIHVMSSRDHLQTLFRWKVARCLYGEIELEGQDFVINAGKWYRLNRDFAHMINEYFEQAPLYDDSWFPKIDEHLSEADFNKMLARSRSDGTLLMDAKNIHYGLSRSKIELCDVLVGCSTFIHVKHYSSSANLSHLFLQGENSARLIQYDEEFVKLANQRIAKETAGAGPELRKGYAEKVVYVILCQRLVKRRPNIPFFSRLSYWSASHELRNMGVDCELCAVLMPKKAKQS